MRTPFSLSTTVGARIPALAAALLLALGLPASAGLTFEKTELSHTAKSTESEHTAIFRFKNTGDAAVTVKKVNTSCGCTTAELKKKEYKPGETGELPVTFKYEDRQGFQMKQIAVETTADTYNLTLEVEIPEFLKLDRPFISWEQKAPAEPQTFEITLASNAPFRVTAGEFENPEHFKGELKEVPAEGQQKKYTFTVTPTSTDKYVKSLIYFKTDLKSETPRVYKAFCMVKPSREGNGNE